jgi:hypothetical protein
MGTTMKAEGDTPKGGREAMPPRRKVIEMSRKISWRELETREETACYLTHGISGILIVRKRVR